jgi:hypothetical protein
MENSELISTLREKFKYGSEEFIPILIELADLHSRKNYDYTFGGDPLGNFNRVAHFFESYPKLSSSDPEIVAITYLMKQLDAILWAKNSGYEGKVEGSDRRYEDVNVYSIIARIIAKKSSESHPVDSSAESVSVLDSGAVELPKMGMTRSWPS